MVQFSDLPYDIINDIFRQCSETNTTNGLRTYIKFKYYNNKIHYHEYTGDMSYGNPNGYGDMRYLIRETENMDLNIPENSYLETDWLYLPFLMVFKDHKPRLILK